MNIETLTEDLNHLLEIDSFKDYGPNGLQVEGIGTIKKLGFAVSATIDSIEKAIANKVDALIVHHGILWGHQGARTLTGSHGQRVRMLIENKINLLGYHLPLDAHIEYGNAVQIAKKLNLQNIMPFAVVKGAPLGVKGDLPQKETPKNFKKKLSKILNRDIVHANPGNNIHSLGIITGGANNEWTHAQADGLDAYLTGEISEYNWHDAKEAGVHFFAGGHHATERFGVLALQAYLADKYQVETVFIDSENPV